MSNERSMGLAELATLQESECDATKACKISVAGHTCPTCGLAQKLVAPHGPMNRRL